MRFLRQLSRRSSAGDGSPTCCRDCGRTPLAGETVHLLESGAAVCALCHSRSPAGVSRAQRVHVDDRLVVVARAA